MNLANCELNCALTQLTVGQYLTGNTSFSTASSRLKFLHLCTPECAMATKQADCGEPQMLGYTMVEKCLLCSPYGVSSHSSQH